MLINLAYPVNLDELAQATTDFVNQRPIMRVMRYLMLLSSIWLISAFVVKNLLGYTSTFGDLCSAIFALAWMFFYHSLHAHLVLYNLKKNAPDNLIFRLQITKQKIHLDNNQDQLSIKLPWNKIRFIAQNSAGYIVPLTGLANSGKFIWIPKTTLEQTGHTQDFLELIDKQHIKLKTYRS